MQVELGFLDSHELARGEAVCMRVLPEELPETGLPFCRRRKVCSKCALFTLQEQLDAHIKKHVFEKPMECPLCNRFFTERADYKEHIQFHRNVRELSCGICSVEFKSDAAIAKHIVEEHGESDGKIEFEVVPDFDEGDAQ